MTIELVVTEREILAEIQKEAIAYINNNLSTLVPFIHEEVGKVVADSIREQPEYASLVDGDLKAQFGIVNPQLIIEDIIRVIVNNIKVTFTKGNGGVAALDIEILRPDYSDILNVSGVSFTSENGFDVPWLQWLIFEGDSIILPAYSVNLNPKNVDISRTGLAVMTKNINGQGFRVPPQFSGTPENNWLTRAVEGVEQSLEKIVETAIQSRL